MASLKNNKRLSEVLELFLLPNYNIVSTTSLDLLLSHISENIKECNADDYEKCEIFQKWVIKATDVWSHEHVPVQPIVIFTLKLVGLASRNELLFHYWQYQDVYNKLCNIFNLHKDDLPISVKMAYTTMLSSLIKHRSGRQWIIDSGVWTDIVKYAHGNYTLYVTHESHKFLCHLLLQEQQNTDFCKEVILTMATPMINNTLESPPYRVSEDSYLDQNKVLCATLDLLTSIIENTIFENSENTISELCLEILSLDTRSKALFEACISTKLLPHIRKLVILCMFVPLKRTVREKKEMVDADVSQKFCWDLSFITLMLLSKTYVIEVVEINKILMVYWKKLQSLHEFKLGEEHKFELQVITIMIVPLAVCIKHTYREHDIFDMFITKMFDVTCTTVQRLAYNVRDAIVKNDLCVSHIAKVSIDKLLEMTNIMDREIAVITFQVLCHVLKNCVPDGNAAKQCLNDTLNSDNGPRRVMYKDPLEGDPIVDHPMLLSSLLNGLAVMTEKFKLKWQECVETICLLSLAQEILNHPGTEPMICVKALQVCKLAIQNFMPPNLVLLVETDNHMNEIGPTFYRRLHDITWKVRDSVLEVLNTIATISENKYPAFQEFLLANDFLSLAIEIAKTDSERYVRASALIFISSTVRINKLWDKKLSQFNLPEVAINLFNGESEAIVRKEAVILIKELYVHRKWPKNVIETISRTMATAAVLDLDWEVKQNALEYWKHFIESHLADQGVLDDHFPKVTFSKEHRKIVSLNETEIKRRLNKALDELAKQNCLGVLLVTLKDDSDFAVCKMSARLINKLKTFLLKYKLNEPLPVSPLPKDSATFDTSYVKYEPTLSNNVESCSYTNEKTTNDSSNVIEEIVDANDANLLASIYKNSMTMDSEPEKSEQKTFRYISCVTRESFLQTIFNSDIYAYIEEKNRWLTSYTTSFESVVEDILTMYTKNDVNTMDCY
ncbi:uncharacterized protein LOC108627770 [Ceratina calcarata]|uniref:Uncharacterized protein LOC108627770 n=1 Tax=Ceratina calcarata TaxID=156304 RepID=A0AAJ7N9Q4_9HYME|nr:uncharacterized protein LOC108627770 [Ceratina calcarata]